MVPMLRSMARVLGRFCRRQNGVAAVEFALIVPIMLAVYIGCSEAASLLTADRKVQSVAGAMGDLVARSNKTISRDQIKDYFLAATNIMAPYNASELVQTVTAVSVTDKGEAIILWSARYNHGSFSDRVPEREKGTPYDLPEEMIAIAKGQTVIAAEADFSYLPLLGIVFKNPVNLYRSGLFMPRFGGEIKLN